MNKEQRERDRTTECSGDSTS